jgi:hypothetical protein
MAILANPNEAQGAPDADGRVSVAEQNAYLADKPVRASGETNTAYNQRVTQWYKDQPHNDLTPAQAAAGATLQWVRTGVGGQGEYKVVYPIGVQYDKTTGEPIIDPNTGKVKNVFTPTTPNTNGKTIVSRTMNPDGSYNVTYSDGTKDVLPGSLTGPTGSNTGTGTGNTVTTGLGGLTTSQLAVTSALDEFKSVLQSVGLGDLATQMDTWIKENRQPAEIKTLVRTSESYARRFPGMKALSDKNMAISEGDYINLERGYTEILNAYGVDTKVFGSRSALGNYIANQINAREFEERVNDAAVRVEAQPDVLNALSLYHGVDKSTAIAYLLDPKLGMDVVRKQVRAAEIGAAALSAGFSEYGIKDIGSQQAENYVSQIGSEDIQTLKKEFGQAAILAQTQARLASIEGQAYNSDTAIQAAVVGNQAAGLESQRRAAREAARFGGAGSGITRESTVGAI